MQTSSRYEQEPTIPLSRIRSTSTLAPLGAAELRQAHGVGLARTTVLTIQASTLALVRQRLRALAPSAHPAVDHGIALCLREVDALEHNLEETKQLAEATRDIAYEQLANSWEPAPESAA